MSRHSSHSTSSTGDEQNGGKSKIKFTKSNSRGEGYIIKLMYCALNFLTSWLCHPIKMNCTV